MLIGQRIRDLREAKDLTQGQIEKRTGLLRSYLSRIENDHTVPSLETLEKIARALEVPLHAFFMPSGGMPSEPAFANKSLHGPYGREREKFLLALRRMSPSKRDLLLSIAVYIAKHNGKR